MPSNKITKITVTPRLRKAEDENGEIVLIARSYRLELFDQSRPTSPDNIRMYTIKENKSVSEVLEKKQLCVIL